MADAKNAKWPLFEMAMSTPSLNSLSLNDSDNSIAVVFQAPVDASVTITRIGVRLTSITGTTPNYKASIQGVATNGDPDGTIKGGGSPNSAVFSPSGLGWSAASWHWVTLDNSYVTTPGEFLSAVIVYDSGTVNGSNLASFAYYLTGVSSELSLPCALDFQTAWTPRSGLPLVAIGTASRPYFFPLKAAANQIFTNASTNEYGFAFTVPSGWCSTYKVAGVRVLYSMPAAGTMAMNLYNGGGAADTTVLQSVTGMDGDYSAAANRQHDFYFTTSPLVTLTAGNTYRIAFKGETANNNTLYYADFEAAADRDAYPFGQNVLWTSRAGGNWTDIATRTPYVTLLLEDITGGGGSGGGFVIGA